MNNLDYSGLTKFYLEFMTLLGIGRLLFLTYLSVI